ALSGPSILRPRNGRQSRATRGVARSETRSLFNRCSTMAETIHAAVGTAPAPNNFQDVETIQSLLNQVPADKGGPQPLLDLDGMTGPLTIGAIRKFQRFHFGWEDGRVDPNQKTLGKLNELDNDPAIGNPIRFAEFQPFDGFDTADPLRNAPPWQMVPLGG